MALHLFCRCGAVYDASKLDENELYTCKECESVLSPSDAIDTEEHAHLQQSAIPKSGTIITLIIIVALALVGVGIGAVKLNKKKSEVVSTHVKKVKNLSDPLDEWETRASTITVVDKSAERAQEYMDDVFERITQARKRVYPAVVQIFNSTATGGGGTGSGAIFYPDGHEDRGNEGYIVSNFHVVQQADLLEVTLSNQETALADLIYADDFCDVAVIKLKDRTKARGITPAKFGDSDKMRVGDYVMSMGAPQGLGRSCALGIINAIGKYIPTPLGTHVSHREHKFFQMDAAINHGNSGGPLVNIHGKIIGMNTLGVIQLQRVGFAIDGNYEQEIANEIVRNHESSSMLFVERSTFGIEFQPLDLIGMTGEGGALVGAVETDGPAYSIGIRPGDIVKAFKGRTVKCDYYNDLADTNYMFTKNEIGTSAEVTWTDVVTGEEQSGTMTSTGIPNQVRYRSMGSRLLFASVMNFAYASAAESYGFSGVSDGGFMIHGWAEPLDLNYQEPFFDLKAAGFQRGDVILSVDKIVPKEVLEMANQIFSHFNRDMRRGTFEPAIFEVVRGGNKLLIPVDLQ